MSQKADQRRMIRDVDISIDSGNAEMESGTDVIALWLCVEGSNYSDVPAPIIKSDKSPLLSIFPTTAAFLGKKKRRRSSVGKEYVGIYIDTAKIPQISKALFKQGMCNTTCISCRGR